MAAPGAIVAYLAEQLGVSAAALEDYGPPGHHTRRDHSQQAIAHLGFHRTSGADLRKLRDWLVVRALEHDRPVLLVELACKRLRSLKRVRPALNRIERIVASARLRAQQETYRLVAPLLTLERKATLDRLLEIDDDTGHTRLAWLRQEATRSTARSIVETIEKLRYLQAVGAREIDLVALNPNRRRFLAKLGNTATSQALERMSAVRRYPILLAFLEHVLQELIDEAIEQFDRCLADTYARARREHDEVRLGMASATHEKLRLLKEFCRIILDPNITDAEVRAFIYRLAPADNLQATQDECDQLISTDNDGHFQILGKSYSYLRQFTPDLLEVLDFRSSQQDEPLLEVIALLRTMNREGARKLPDDAPTAFVPAKWRPYVNGQGQQLDRHYYELCALWELRAALRAGDVWLRESRRYADPESYLIPRARWPELRADACQLIGAPTDGAERLAERQRALDDLCERFDQRLGENGRVRVENDRLVVGPLPAEERPASVIELERLVDERLPFVDLSDLLMEVDGWTSFSQSFEHAGKSEPRSKDLLVHCHASVLAQACNFGLTRMARIADLSYSRLAWCTTWYLHEETLRAANDRIVNFHFRHPLSRVWGGGTLSSSDGQRFPVAVRTRSATAIPRYFGFGKGLTFYSWTSDQFSQFGSKPTSSTTRDATYVLDGILDNETELPLFEHTTDTAGYTDLVFALFDLLGLQFSPRLRDLGDQRLYRIDKSVRYQHLDPLMRGSIRRDFILKHWDDLLRLAGSLKMGWVTASLFIGKLQSYRRQNTLTRVLQEYGRFIKTIFILRYLDDEEYRRRIGVQLNKGEALHALRRFLLFADEGQIRRRTHDDQLNQASCLNLVTNAVVAWNTVYMAAVLEQLRSEGHHFTDADVAHLSPARYEHINPHGHYHFDPAQATLGRKLRPLRRP
jgi:TnpA family transposase